MPEARIQKYQEALSHRNRGEAQYQKEMRRWEIVRKLMPQQNRYFLKLPAIVTIEQKLFREGFHIDDGI